MDSHDGCRPTTKRVQQPPRETPCGQNETPRSQNDTPGRIICCTFSTTGLTVIISESRHCLPQLHIVMVGTMTWYDTPITDNATTLWNGIDWCVSSYLWFRSEPVYRFFLLELNLYLHVSCPIDADVDADADWCWCSNQTSSHFYSYAGIYSQVPLKLIPSTPVLLTTPKYLPFIKIPFTCLKLLLLITSYRGIV